MKTVSRCKKDYEDANVQALKEKRAKTRWSLFPWEQLKETGSIFTDGAAKYTDDGWKYNTVDQFQNALSRHMVAYMSGEMKDQESGYDHLSHIIANALILRWHHGQTRTDK